MPKNMNGPAVGFDLGGTKMLALVLDDDGKVIGRERKKTRSAAPPPDGSASQVEPERIFKTIRAALEQAGAPSPSSIGMGVPGMLNLETGVVLDAPNLGWKNVPLRKRLEETFGCPVTLVNDVDAGTFGEYARGAARKAHCAIGIFPGTGIGAGCVYKGDLFTGKKGSCMEIGHLPLDPDGLPCGCGRRGCLETIASRLAIASAAAAAVFRGQAPHLAALAGTDIAKIRSGALAESIKAGDKVIEEIVRRAARFIGRAAACAIDLMAPDYLILGGGLVEAMPEIFHPEVERAAREAALPVFRDSFKVEVAALGDDATALGAAAWAARRAEAA